jgi:hypothetical protein
MHVHPPVALRRLSMVAIVGAAIALPLALPSAAHAWWVRGGWGWGPGISIGVTIPAWRPPVVYAPPAPVIVAAPPVAYVPPPPVVVAPRVWVRGYWNGAYWVPGHWR